MWRIVVNNLIGNNELGACAETHTRTPYRSPDLSLVRKVVKLQYRSVAACLTVLCGGSGSQLDVCLKFVLMLLRRALARRLLRQNNVGAYSEGYGRGQTDCHG